MVEKDHLNSERRNSKKFNDILNGKRVDICFNLIKENNLKPPTEGKKEEIKNKIK